MSRFFRLFTLFFAFLLVFVLVLPAFAQDTPTSEEPTTVVADAPTLESPAEVTEVPAPPSEQPAPPVLQPGEVAVNLSTILLGLVVSFVAGAGILGFLINVRSDKPTLDAIERLANSLPVETLDKLLEFSKIIQETGKLLETVTDRLPNEPTPPAPPQ